MNKNETWGESLQWCLSIPKKLASVAGLGWVIDLNLFIAVVMQFVLAGFIAGFLYVTFGWVWAAWMWGGTAVSLLLGWTKWIQFWFAVLRFNYAAAYENALSERENPNGQKPADIERLTKVVASRSTRVVLGAAIVGTNPLQRLVRDKAISLIRALPIKPKNIELLTADGATLMADASIFFTALKNDSGVACLIQHKEWYIIDYLTKYSVSWLEKKARGMTLNQIFAGLVVENGTVKIISGSRTAITTTTGEFEAGFSAFLGGKDTLHQIETELGGFTGNPLVSIRLHPDLASALQSQLIVNISIVGVKKYQTEGGLDADVAANMEASIRGKPMPVQIIRAPDSLHYVADARQSGGNR